MPCNTCNKQLLFTLSSAPRTAQQCEYNLDMLLDWKDKLLCVRDKNLYLDIGITKIQINSFLGVVLSGVNFEYNICFLSNKLDNIKPFILKIIDSGRC